jgi:hypothetical protein
LLFVFSSGPLSFSATDLIDFGRRPFSAKVDFVLCLKVQAGVGPLFFAHLSLHGAEVRAQWQAG